MRRHCLDIGLNQGTLTLFLDSPAWASKARFLTDDIVRSTRDRQVKEVRIQVRPGGTSAPAADSAADTRHHLTTGAVAHLLEAADLMRDPELANAFRRFADRHRHGDSRNKT